MSNEQELSIKPIQIRFGPRDEAPYAELIEHLLSIPEGSRARAAKNLMLFALRVQEQGGQLISVPTSPLASTSVNNKVNLEPSPLDAGLLPNRKRNRD